MRREVIPGVDRPLTVGEISDIYGPYAQKRDEEYKEFIRQGGNLDGWAKYESSKRKREKDQEEMKDLVKKSRFVEWFEFDGADLPEFKKEIQEGDALELESMATELLFQHQNFCENQNPANFDRLAEDLEFVALLCREYADFMRKVEKLA